MTKTILIIDPAAGDVVDAVLFEDGSAVAAGGSAILLPDGAEFPAPPDRLFFDGPGGIGWGWDGEAAIAPPPPAVDLVAYAADARWRKEVGGITIAGVPVATDDRSKLMITGARVAAMADSGWSTVWHGSDGLTYPVDAAAMVVISDAVQAHVNAGFATFATVKAAIAADTITTTAEIDAAFGL
jgi:hypothetical protein